MNQHPQVRWIYLGQTQRGFEVMCNVCKVGGIATHAAQVETFVSQHANHQSQATGYYGAGDVVAAATKRLGIETCTPCEARRRQLNGLLPKVWRR